MWQGGILWGAVRGRVTSCGGPCHGAGPTPHRALHRGAGSMAQAEYWALWRRKPPRGAWAACYGAKPHSTGLRHPRPTPRTTVWGRTSHPTGAMGQRESGSSCRQRMQAREQAGNMGDPVVGHTGALPPSPSWHTPAPQLALGGKMWTCLSFPPGAVGHRPDASCRAGVWRQLLPHPPGGLRVPVAPSPRRQSPTSWLPGGRCRGVSQRITHAGNSQHPA